MSELPNSLDATSDQQRFLQPLTLVSVFAALILLMFFGLYVYKAQKFTSLVKNNVAQTGVLGLGFLCLVLLFIFDTMTRSPTLSVLQYATTAPPPTYYAPFNLNQQVGLILQHAFTLLVLVIGVFSSWIRLFDIHPLYASRKIVYVVAAYTFAQVLQFTFYAAVADPNVNVVSAVITFDLFMLPLQNIAIMAVFVRLFMTIRNQEGTLSMHEKKLFIYAGLSWVLLIMGDLALVVAMIVTWAGSSGLPQIDGYLYPASEISRLLSRILWLLAYVCLMQLHSTRLWKLPAIDAAMELWFKLTEPERRPLKGQGDVA
ncbi:hypothetical protein MIR68_000399 [Amoeboaphelidium protococcarum]|nr:hypothetical protein MIR68_000399 [Amoeboaphelidium protococcarum]